MNVTLNDTLGDIAAARIVPVIMINDVAQARPLSKALRRGGLVCAEVTLRTAAAEESLRVLAQETDLLVGAGTVINPEQVDRAVTAGARYIVSPGFSPSVVHRCKEEGITVVPGIATATELQAAVDAGLSVVKLFPAEPLGGLAMLNALAGPFPDVRFVPTGGIGAAQLSAYLAHPAVIAVGGSWMVPPHLFATGDWAEVARLCADALAISRS